MPATRLSHDEQIDLALDALTELGRQSKRLSIVVSGPEQVDIYLDDEPIGPARVIAYDALGEAQARQVVANAPRGRKIVVANKISEPARRHLTSQRWAWLDRRIGASVPIGSRTIEVEYVEAPWRKGMADGGSSVWTTRPAAEGPVRGRAGIAYAAALLCDPNAPPSLRKVAEAVDMSPTSVSNAAKRLVDAGLVGSDSKPSCPDLFWTLAEVWSPLKSFAVATAPEPSARGFATNVKRLDQPGWVLGGDLAAAALGAPLFSVEHRPWLWVPTQVELRRARRAFEPADWDDRAAVIAVPPTPLVTKWRSARTRDVEWPLPHPVFAALDLARDPGRGREILDQWTPEGVEPVWR